MPDTHSPLLKATLAPGLDRPDAPPAKEPSLRTERGSRWAMSGVLAVLFLAGCAVVVLGSSSSAAFPTMVRHGYVSCQACHVDPSGGGQLTLYGRAQSDLLVRWHWDPSVLEEREPPTGFLFGLLELPDVLNLSGNVRGGGLYNETTEGKGAGLRPVLMVADANATVRFDRFVAHASVGYGLRNVGPAVVLSPNGGPDNALVARELWVGARFFDEQLTLRAGRIQMPFGLRNNEHVSLVRSLTRTDTNVHQQTGVAASWNGEGWRGEVMALLGNYQIRPDVYRERGGAGFFELALAPELALGVSSLATWAGADIDRNIPLLRQAHGAFLRYAPARWLALLGEADLLLDWSPDDGLRAGAVGWLQADFEPWQGIHLIPALEAAHVDFRTGWPTLGAWLSASWFALPQTELRLDAIYRQTPIAAPRRNGVFTALAQIHFFL